MNHKNPKVDFYFMKGGKWQEDFQLLRTLILDCRPAGQSGGLTEELKWGHPCYAFEGSNIVLMHGFKDYCALLFFKGVLLKDPKGILLQQTANVQAARQMRFISSGEIVKMKSVIKAYIKEAIELEKAGAKVPLKKTKEFDMPEEFQHKLNKSAALKKAFYALTPGRQRGYLLHFASAKQSKTREARVEKYEKQILRGKGLDDQTHRYEKK